MNRVRARELILRHGWNANAYQLFNPGMEYWFSGDRETVVGFVQAGGVRVVAGIPVGPLGRIGEVLEEFESVGGTVCYFGVERPAAFGPNRARVQIGAQGWFVPGDWSEMLGENRSLRAQLSRARNKGVQVASEAPNHRELAPCRADWLSKRRMPAMGFLTTPNLLGDLKDRMLFVARLEGRVIGFLLASPVPARNGWLIEQIVQGARAPNGTAELLVDAAVQQMAGSSLVTLGFSALAHSPGRNDNPAWIRAAFAGIRRFGRRFYDFEGLESFKAKFKPADWEPVYAVSSERRFSPAMLYAIAGAFTGGSPVRFIAQAVLAARLRRDRTDPADRSDLRRTNPALTKAL